MPGEHLTSQNYVNNIRMKKSSELIEISTFKNNQFLTTSLIFNFKPAFFVLWKMNADFNSHIVKKQVVLKCAIPPLARTVEKQ